MKSKKTDIYTKDHQRRYSKTKYFLFIFNENLSSCCRGARSPQQTSKIKKKKKKKTMNATFFFNLSRYHGTLLFLSAIGHWHKRGLHSINYLGLPHTAQSRYFFWRDAKTFNRNCLCGKPCCAARWQRERHVHCNWRERRLLNMNN